MHLTFAYPYALLLLASIFAAAASYWVYSHTVPELSRGRTAFLGALRFLVLFLVLLLLAEPLLTRESVQTEDPVLAVLLDESESMTLVQSDSVAAADRSFSSDFIGRVAEATRSERTRLFGFGSAPREISGFDSVKFTGARTDLSAGLDFVRTRLENESLGAVLLISDGRHNGGRNPEHLADLYPVPIVSVTLGDTTIRKDIRIQQILKNDLSYVGREVPIRVRIRNEGFEPSQIRVDFSSGNQVLDRQNVVLPPSGSETEVDLAFSPDSVGLFQYRVDITRLTGELTHRNNSEIFSLQILERERRILLVAGAPSPDLAAVRRQLDADTDTNLQVRVQKGTLDGTYYEGTLQDAPDELDLLILVGFPTSTTTTADVDRIVEIIENGVPILFMLDRSADLQVIERRLSSVLPARPTILRPGFVEGSFVPTAIASRHAVFDIQDRQSQQQWSLLPPLSLSQSQWDAAPTAVTLAISQIRGITIDDPIFVVAHYGARRSASLLASGFWRWYNVPEDLETAAARWETLFSNLITWLVSVDDERPVRVSPVESLLNEGEHAVFGGQVYDESNQPVSDVSLTVDVRFPTGDVFPYTLQSLGNGRYRADIGTFPQGTYTYQATATMDASLLGTDQGSFTVGALSAEFRNPYADARLMRQVAQRSGGVEITLDRLEDLPSILASLPTYVKSTQTVETQTRLWRFLPILFLIILLMTIEWFFRKRFGLV